MQQHKRQGLQDLKPCSESVHRAEKRQQSQLDKSTSFVVKCGMPWAFFLQRATDL